MSNLIYKFHFCGEGGSFRAVFWLGQHCQQWFCLTGLTVQTDPEVVKQHTKLEKKEIKLKKEYDKQEQKKRRR